MIFKKSYVVIVVAILIISLLTINVSAVIESETTPPALETETSTSESNTTTTAPPHNTETSTSESNTTTTAPPHNTETSASESNTTTVPPHNTETTTAVTTKKNIGNIIISKGTLTLNKGETFKLTYKLEALDNVTTKVNFSSNNKSVATIDNNGTITAVSEGKAVITVRIANTEIFKTCSVTVSKNVLPEKIEFPKKIIEMKTGESIAMNVAVLPENANDKTLEYSSTNDSIASVDENGIVTGKTTGIVTVTATLKSSKVADTCIVKVSDEATASNTSTITGLLISERGEPIANRQIKLLFNNNWITAKTDNNGKFSFKNIDFGTYPIFLTNKDNPDGIDASGNIIIQKSKLDFKATIKGIEISIVENNTLEIVNKFNGFNISKTEIDLDVDETYIISFSSNPQGLLLPKIIGMSSDENIVTVSENGEFKAISEGLAEVIFTTEDGKFSKACKVSVIKGESSKYSLLIIIVEALILITIVTAFVVIYKGFIRQKIRAEKRLDR